jgi:hypothetical protein
MMFNFAITCLMPFIRGGHFKLIAVINKNERFSAFRPVGRHVTATPDSTKTDDKLSCDDDENDEINITDETNDNDAKEVTDELLPTI